jgi:hypothetical protein
LGAKWLKIIFVMWDRQIPYDEPHHLVRASAHRDQPDRSIVITRIGRS